MKHQSIVRRCAAVTAAVTLALGASSLLAPADAAKATPKKGSVTATVPLTCNVFGTPFDYPAKIKLSGVRAPKAASVALKATLSEMPGVAPVPLNYDTKTILTLSMGGKKTVLKGKGHVDVPAQAPVADGGGEGLDQERIELVRDHGHEVLDDALVGRRRGHDHRLHPDRLQGARHPQAQVI